MVRGPSLVKRAILTGLHRRRTARLARKLPRAQALLRQRGRVRG